jgi:hypothetical protein
VVRRSIERVFAGELASGKPWRVTVRSQDREADLEIESGVLTADDMHALRTAFAASFLEMS